MENSSRAVFTIFLVLSVICAVILARPAQPRSDVRVARSVRTPLLCLLDPHYHLCKTTRVRRQLVPQGYLVRLCMKKPDHYLCKVRRSKRQVAPQGYLVYLCNSKPDHYLCRYRRPSKRRPRSLPVTARRHRRNPFLPSVINLCKSAPKHWLCRYYRPEKRKSPS